MLTTMTTLVAPPAYSKLLCSAHGLTGVTDHLLFTVPAGRVWILRDLDLTLTGGAPGNIFLLDEDAVQFAQWLGVAANTYIPWRGRQVFAAGSELHLFTNGGTWDLRGSGYDLSA